MDTKPTKHRRVKTVCERANDLELFDKRVNKALAEGWYLVRRYTLPSYHDGAHTMLVAELQRWDEHDE